MEELSEVKRFIEQAEKFKATEKYQSMPNEHRDFFNEEIGRFKLMVELDNSCKSAQKKKVDKSDIITQALLKLFEDPEADQLKRIPGSMRYKFGLSKEKECQSCAMYRNKAGFNADLPCPDCGKYGS